MRAALISTWADATDDVGWRRVFFTVKQTINATGAMREVIQNASDEQIQAVYNQHLINLITGQTQ